jgi:hypothetical protein
MRDACTGTAMVYSGRPDPEWPVSADARRRLEAIWRQLTAATAAALPAPPPLGYRGCALRCRTGGEWFAYGGVVSHTTASREVDRRGDPERRFERLLLSTAPERTLPPTAV